MTEGTTTNTAAVDEPWSDPDGYTRDDLTANDLFLEELIGALLGIEAHDGSLGLTLMTSGGVISGDAISLGSWERALVELISTANPAVGEAVSPLDGWVEAQKADYDSRYERELPPVPVRFVHLKNAKVWTGARELNVGLWRGRIAQIGGWSLGTF